MYQKSFSNKRSAPQHSYRGGSSNKGGFSGGKRNFRKTKNTQGSQYINPSRFICKAQPIEEAEAFVPKHTFADFSVSEELAQNLIKKGYEQPTAIQDSTIEYVLKGKDVVGIANTGTGKTAAFLIPLIDKVLKNPQEQVLIIAPTRELALQIDSELKAFTRGMQLYSVCVVGGAPIRQQLKSLRYKNNFVIGTPGRLKDLIERRSIHLAQFSTLVLDEADRMLDMGFINDIRYVVKGMPDVHHTLFFSATLSHEIEGLISEFLNNPMRISVKTGDTSKNVEQDVVRVGNSKGKFDILHKLLGDEDFTKVLVFGRTKHGVEKLSHLLAGRGVKAESIHGNKSHVQRQRALRRFKDNQVQVLVATDVAARGLDIANVSHVINYDVPSTYDDYVHRIGRTGRGNKRGKALTFID